MSINYGWDFYNDNEKSCLLSHEVRIATSLNELYDMLGFIQLDPEPTNFTNHKSLYRVLKKIVVELHNKFVDLSGNVGSFERTLEKLIDIRSALSRIQAFFTQEFELDIEEDEEEKMEKGDIIQLVLRDVERYHILSDEEIAVLHIYLGKKGNIDSIIKLARYYAFGFFSNKNPTKSSKHYLIGNIDFGHSFITDYVLENAIFGENLPKVNEILDFDNFIKWLEVGVDLKHVEMMRIKMLIYFNGFGSINKDLDKAELLLYELIEMDKDLYTYKFSNSYYAVFLARIQLSRG